MRCPRMVGVVALALQLMVASSIGPGGSCPLDGAEDDGIARFPPCDCAEKPPPAALLSLHTLDSSPQQLMRVSNAMLCDAGFPSRTMAEVRALRTGHGIYPRDCHDSEQRWATCATPHSMRMDRSDPDAEPFSKFKPWGHFIEQRALTELHHAQYGAPWLHGIEEAMMLRQIGALRPNSTMLEVGCGAGRASIHFIRYLERGRFHCVEADELSLRAAITYETPLNGVAHLAPRFALSSKFDLSRLTPPGGAPPRFDLVTFFSVLNHLTDAQVTSALRIVTAALNPGGVIVTTHDWNLELAAAVGFACEVKHTRVGNAHLCSRRAGAPPPAAAARALRAENATQL